MDQSHVRLLEHVSPALLRVLDRLADTPALILTDLGETLAQTPAAEVLFGDHRGRTGAARSACYRWFTDPAERRVHPERDHDRIGRQRAAELRAALATGSAERAAELVARLRERSPEFVRIWTQDEPVDRFDEHVTVLHPDRGELALDCQQLFTEDRTQRLLVLV